MNRLTKNERLHSRKQIEYLLTHGSSFFVFPFKIIYSFQSWNDPLSASIASGAGIQYQSLVAVPKRRIKKAVKRNLIKRRTRESIRLHKTSLPALKEKRLYFILQYVANEPLPYTSIAAAVKTIIGKFPVIFTD